MTAEKEVLTSLGLSNGKPGAVNHHELGELKNSKLTGIFRRAIATDDRKRKYSRQTRIHLYVHVSPEV